jgi:opacity protein-like surface antigen
MWGGGGSIGAAGPADDSLQNGLDVSGNLERYLTPRLSIRGQAGLTSWDVQQRGFTGTIMPFYADANLVYNWEGGAVHPYVTGGVGVYHYHASESATQDRSDTKPGFDFGGGVEYFFNRHTTMTGELQYHKVGEIATPLTTFQDGSFWRFGVGLKRYF